MKKLLSATLVFIPLFGFSQKLTKNSIDEFTRAAIKETSWDRIYRGWGGEALIKTRKIDSSYYLDFKFCDGSVFSIPQGERLMFKLEDSSVVEIKAFKYAITGIGDGSVGLVGSGAMGIDAEYSIDQIALLELKKTKAVKLRFYTSEGYVDLDIKKGSGETIIKSLTLVQ